MTANILIDTGFWIALLDPSDDPKRNLLAQEIADVINDDVFLLPFPTLYEFVSSRLSRREAVFKFEKFCLQSNVKRISDEEYKEQALTNFFLLNHYSYSDLSLVDEVLKLFMADRNFKIDYLISFDNGLRNAALSLNIKLIE